MNRRAITAIVRKDLKVVFQNKGVLIPLIIVPVIFLAGLPALAGFAPMLDSASGGPLDDMLRLLENMPSGLLSELVGYSTSQKVVVLALEYLLAPMFLIVPLMVASVIAADSFAGEKERKTLEALIYTPTTDIELFLAKTLSAMLPAVGVALVGALVYCLVANIAAWPTMGTIFLPNVMWALLVIWVSPAVAGLGLCTMVLVSARAQGFQDAYQLGAVVVLPVLLLVFGQGAGLLYFSVELVLLLGLVLWVLDVALLWLGGRMFKRGEIIARL